LGKLAVFVQALSVPIDCDAISERKIHTLALDKTGKCKDVKWREILIFTVIIIIAGTGSTAFATSFYGYEVYGGEWQDAEKTLSNTEDDELCWAAAASNVLDWTGWGGNAPGGNFNNEDDIFGYFQDHWTDEAGSMAYGWDWWFDGTNDSEGQSGWSSVDEPGGGFWDPVYDFNDYFAYTSEQNLTMSAVDFLLRDGYGVTIGVTPGSGGHAVSVWGYEYGTTTNDYLGIWITDSDDDKSTDSPPDTLRYYDVTYDGVKWNLEDFYASDDWYIVEVQALNRYAAAQPVPEPGTMLLVGIGISGLYGLRRKRSKQ